MLGVMDPPPVEELDPGRGVRLLSPVPIGGDTVVSCPTSYCVLEIEPLLPVEARLTEVSEPRRRCCGAPEGISAIRGAPGASESLLPIESSAPGAGPDCEGRRDIEVEPPNPPALVSDRPLIVLCIPGGPAVPLDPAKRDSGRLL